MDLNRLTEQSQEALRKAQELAVRRRSHYAAAVLGAARHRAASRRSAATVGPSRRDVDVLRDAPAATRLGRVTGDPNTGTGTWTAQMWQDAVTENPAVGATEVWEFYNGTADAHPMHIHEVLFQVVNRQEIIVDEDNKTFQVAPGSKPRPPKPWENGWKDTVIAYPDQVTRVTMKFEVAGQYVWHCHIVEHEDNEMMRPYRIGPVQPRQPGSGHSK